MDEEVGKTPSMIPDKECCSAEESSTLSLGLRHKKLVKKWG